MTTESTIPQWLSKTNATIIDARSPREYIEDHIPGAINFPVLNNDEYAEIGTLHRTDKFAAYRIGVAYAQDNMARALRDYPSLFDSNSTFLVYCFRGGKRSKLWLDTLTTCGLRAERVQGGWKAYRRSVNELLATIPTQFQYRVLGGASGVGKTRILQALAALGEQVLDLEGLASHRGSLMGAVPGQAQPSQKWFDSQLLQQMHSFNKDRPIWLEAESKKIGQVQLPDALLKGMHASGVIEIESPMPVRLQVWEEDFGYFAKMPQDLMRILEPLRPLVGNIIFEEWQKNADSNQMLPLFESLMVNHYDVCYLRSFARNYPLTHGRVYLADLTESSLRAVADELVNVYALRNQDDNN
jgi:tRNA 2-selenouridine synthase